MHLVSIIIKAVEGNPPDPFLINLEVYPFIPSYKSTAILLGFEAWIDPKYANMSDRDAI